MTDNLDPTWLGNSSEEDEIYRENILDHFKHPRNFGKLTEYNLSSKEFNPVCGDQIELFIKLKNNKVEDVKFTGKGCAISMASISMLTEKIRGLNLEELRNLNKEDILEMIGIQLGVVRMKCGLLSLKALLNGLSKLEEENEQIRN